MVYEKVDLKFTHEDGKRYRDMALQFKNRCDKLECKLFAAENTIRCLREENVNLKITLKQERAKHGK